MAKSKTGFNAAGKKEIPLIEWLTASIGIGIVLFLIIFLLIEAKEGADKPPDIEVKVNKIIHGEAHFNVMIDVHNSGSQTAEGVIIKGELLNGDRIIENSETMFDYIPGESKREGGLMFINDPQKYKLRIKALGYERP